LFCAGKTGKVCWKDNWVAFLDNMLQMTLIQEDSQDLLVPTSLQKLTIDPKWHASQVQELAAKSNEVGELVQLNSVY
jgi:fatty acid synthase